MLYWLVLQLSKSYGARQSLEAELSGAQRRESALRAQMDEMGRTIDRLESERQARLAVGDMHQLHGMIQPPTTDSTRSKHNMNFPCSYCPHLH